jgi:MtN3 and saliva related transmembrane protein
MSLLDFLGFAAGVLTTIAFLPQAILTWRLKRAAGVSLGMYATFTVGVALWLAYGIGIGSWPVIIANAITLALALFILAMKLRFG